MPKTSRKTLAMAIFLSLLPSFLYALFRFSIGVALPEISRDFLLDSSQAGVLLSISLAATTATTGLAGYLSDRFGEKPVMTTGILMYSAGLLGVLVSQGYHVFVALIVLNGLGSGLMITPTYSVVGRLAPKSRGVGTGVLSGFYNIGGFVGPVLTSMFLATSGWRLPFALMGGVGALVAVLVILLLTVPSPSVRVGDSRASLSSSLRLFRKRNMAIIGATMLLGDLAFLAFASWVPTFMRMELLMTPGQAGFFFGLAVAVGGVGVMSMGYLFDRIGGKRATLVAATMSAVLTLLFLLHLDGYWLSIALLVLTGFFANSFWSLLSALAQVSVDESHLGTATGIIQNIGFVGAMIGPFVAGSLVGALPISSALIISVTLPYAIYALLMTLYRSDRESARR